jgi:hypothetical protein
MKSVTQREGWLGEDYVRIYAEHDRDRIAKLYAFERFLPGYAPWGSWGLDALCLGPDGRLYLIPWIPLHESHRKERYQSADGLEAELSLLHEATPQYEHFAKETHFVTPIVFGGSPTDPENLKMIGQQPHAEVCCFWNQTYARLKAKAERGACT